MNKIYTPSYFKELWKIIWRLTRTEKGNAINVFVNKSHFKHTNKMYIVANMLYKSLQNNTPCNFSNINIKFEL